MEKKKYFVSVQSRSIMLEQGQAPYELEIEATESEVQDLQLLFEEFEESDHATFFRTAIPGLPYHHDLENDDYDQMLKQCYERIYQLGNNETRAHLSAFIKNIQMGHHHEESFNNEPETNI